MNSAYQERWKRVEDALALREPDRVPCIPHYQSFPYLAAGYTMAEVMYDIEKAKDAIRRYLRHFEPDMSYGISDSFAGQGPLLDKLDPKWLTWPGRPGVGALHGVQYIENEYMEEDDYQELLHDHGGWVLRKYLPRAYKSLEALAKLDLRSGVGYGYGAMALSFADPAVQQAFRTLGEAGQLAGQFYAQVGAFDAETEEMGFPIHDAATITCAFDSLSDCLRGTIPASLDLFSCPELMHQAIEQLYPGTFFGAMAQASHSRGRFIFIPMHKGMDGFMSDEQYRGFYWDTLERLVHALIDAGKIPLLYTEGRYNTRLEFLKDVPKGKAFIHFESVDMKEAKRIVGSNVCISGGMRTDVLVRGTPEQTRDEVRRTLDICAPGGGYIFDVSDTMEHCQVANVEAMFDEVKTYGKY